MDDCHRQIDCVPITPPSQSANATWTKPHINFAVKDSPARAPDPEHLKAVWSQPSNKARVHSINSLEGIADDLTALPFTLQDVKSEDGGTPPPTTSTAPSRMSLHDVTKAFQQVPSSSSTSTAQHPAPVSPSNAAGPVARPPGYSHNPLPPSSASIRPSYAPYPSPMMSHSPSPTLVYAMSSNSIPRMQPNGHSPFNQPLWMPVGPQSQTPGNMMRPVPSPYPSQMVAYPAPGGPSMYGPHPQPHPQTPTVQHLGSATGRGRGMPMSPRMQHAPATIYPGSPVLMHTPGMHPHHNQYMSPVSNSRGQLRPDLPGQHVAPSSGYAPVTQTSFVRPNW